MAADNSVRNCVFYKRAFNRARHGVHAVKHRVVAERVPLRDGIQNLTGYVIGFFGLILRRFQRNFSALAVRRPKIFAFPLAVVGNHGVGGIQYILRGTIILLQTNDHRIRVAGFKAQNIFNRRAAEAVNALVIVADHADVAVAVGKQRSKLILRVVGVLILVDHNIAKLPLIVFQHIGVFF